MTCDQLPRTLLLVFPLAVCALLLGACASGPPTPDWQTHAKAASERASLAYLTGNARVESAELARARSEVARTGRADLLARVELTHCATMVASLVFGPCAGFEPLRTDATAAERAYADYLLARHTSADTPLLPESQRALAHRQQFQRGLSTTLDGCSQRLPVCMNRQEFHAHCRNPRSGPTNRFLDIEELEVQEHPLASRDQALDHLRSGSGVEFESDLHEHDLTLHSIEKPVGFVA